MPALSRAHRPASGATWCLFTKSVVEERAEDRADARRDDRHPPPSAARREHAAAPAGHGREQPRAKIARRIDRIAGVESERHADGDDDAADERTGQPCRRRDVALIGHGEHAGHQQHRADDLIDKAAGDRQERLRIRREDAGGRRGALDHAHAAVECRKRLAIGGKHDRRRRERAGHLRQRVRQHLAPRKLRCTASATVTAGFRCAPDTPPAV